MSLDSNSIVVCYCIKSAMFDQSTDYFDYLEQQQSQHNYLLESTKEITKLRLCTVSMWHTGLKELFS